MGVFEFLWRLMVLPFGSPPKLIEAEIPSNINLAKSAMVIRRRDWSVLPT